MKRLTLGLLAVAIAVFTVCGVAVAQTSPEFKFGFKALADQIPDVVGQPVENEHWGANGDSLQQTAEGLMVWRKADNWTAFPNGSRTWINGPFGIQERANTDRFEWDEDPLAPNSNPVTPPPSAPPMLTPTPTAPATPTAQPFTIRERVEAAQLKQADMPAGYTVLYKRWANDTKTELEAQYGAASTFDGPNVLSDIFLWTSDTDAQAFLDDTTRRLPSGFVWVPSPLARVPTSRAYTLTWFQPGPHRTYMVFFRVGSVVGRVSVAGFDSLTSMDQAVRFAQMVVDRLLATQH